MMRSKVLLLSLALALSGFVLAPAAVPGVALAQCEPPAHRGVRTETFPAVITILDSPLLHVQLVGFGGSGSGRIIWQPIPAPPPAVSDGCKENTRFTVENFQGVMIATNRTGAPLTVGPITIPAGAVPVVVLATTEPIDASLLVHFGPAREPNKPMVTFRSDKPVLFLPGTPAQTSVRFVHLVGGAVNHIVIR